MAILYVDWEGGNDNYAGSSFSLLASGIDGRISNTTFSSVTANFSNDGSLIDQYLSIFNGTIYAVYRITAWISSTSLTISAISGGTSVANQVVDRQFYIGGRWKSLSFRSDANIGASAVRIAPGDEIRIMGSPAPTSLGQNGVWTSQARQSFLWINGQTTNPVGSTNTTPIVMGVTNHGYSTGDTVAIAGHIVNTTANGIWEITVIDSNRFSLNGSVATVGGGTGWQGTSTKVSNCRVLLETPVTQNIASTGPGRTAWVASANCSHTFNGAFFKEHLNSDQITMLAAFTTGKAAYYALPATLDLSAYQQVSFWLYVSGDTLQDGEAELRLCSDAVGDVTVDTVPIPYTPGGRFRAVTWDKGSALGSSIASVSLFINSDLSTTGNVALMFSNIIACKASSAADSLTLTSLIGKNVDGETFWGIQSINGTRVMLDADTNATPTSGSSTLRGYYGTSETVTTWKRETVKIGPRPGFNDMQIIRDACQYSGGWDRTDMSTQNLETWWDGVSGAGNALDFFSGGYTLTKMAFVRFSQALYIGNAGGAILDIIAANNNTSGSSNTGILNFYTSSLCKYFKIGHAVANTGNAIGTGGPVNFILEHSIASNGSSAFYNYNGWGQISTLIKGSGAGLVANNGSNGLENAAGLVRDIVFADHGGSDVMTTGGARTEILYLRNCQFNSSSEVVVQTGNIQVVISSHKHDQAAGNHRIFLAGAVISSATDQRKTASGISWKIQPTSTSVRTADFPVILSLAKVACAANSLVTVKAWMRRSNTGLTMRLVCKGGQIAGVPDDVVDAMTAAADTWAEQTITFTPSEADVVEITAEAWGGTTFSGWVDDMTISQA